MELLLKGERFRIIFHFYPNEKISGYVGAMSCNVRTDSFVFQTAKTGRTRLYRLRCHQAD